MDFEMAALGGVGRWRTRYIKQHGQSAHPTREDTDKKYLSVPPGEETPNMKLGAFEFEDGVGKRKEGQGSAREQVSKGKKRRARFSARFLDSLCSLEMT